MKPNLFSIATKELSQDAFITWLLQWADDSCLEENPKLCNIGKDFIKTLISLKYDIGDIQIKKVNAGRQWANIDIWAEVNDEYIIIIEDKVNTSEHSNQLERYRKSVEDFYGKTIKPVFVYLKTGIECMDTVRQIKEKGWCYYSRKDFLDFLQQHESESEIYSDFLFNLAAIQKESESFIKYEKLNSWEATKGLFSYIENNIENEWLRWDYVPNPKGGFLGLWFHFTSIANEKNCELYLQIENNCNGKINLFIKICGKWKRNCDELNRMLELFMEKTPDYNITISKPQRYRIGEYTSVAIVNDAFVKKENGDLDLENLFEKIEKASDLIDSVSQLL